MKWSRLANCQLIWGCPCLIAVEEELDAKDEQPDPEGKAQLMARNAGAEDGSGDGSGDAANNQVHQQLRVGGVREPMCAAANERDDKAKGNICTDYLRGFQSSEAEQRRRARAPAPAEEKPTSAPTGSISHESRDLRS